MYLKANYSIIGDIVSNPSDSKYSFEVPVQNKSSVFVGIMPSTNTIESFHQADVSNEMYRVLQSMQTDARQLSDPLQNELKSMGKTLADATRNVLNLIKFCLGQENITESLFSSKGEFWSEDKVNWNPMPGMIYMTMNSRGLLSLNANTAKSVQDYLLADFRPFFALRHLHKAIREINPRYKWIDATIAAELAIKEFLIRLKPEIETLLLEMPSPPMHKLYGSVLESFTTHRSPKLAELSRGAETRNKLLHRPNETIITDEEANAYTHDVESTIYHLMTLLYPNDLVIKRLYSMF